MVDVTLLITNFCDVNEIKHLKSCGRKCDESKIGMTIGFSLKRGIRIELQAIAGNKSSQLKRP